MYKVFNILITRKIKLKKKKKIIIITAIYKLRVHNIKDIANTI